MGAAVTMNGRKKLLTRHDGGWAYHNDANQRPAREFWFEGMELVSVPDPVYDGPQVGDVVTTLEQLTALPVGSVVARSSNPQYRFQRGDAFGRREDEWFAVHGGDYYRPDYVVANHKDLVVDSLPERIGTESLGQFAWRFRDLALTGAERAGQGARVALEVLERMDLPFRPTPGLRITSSHDRELLPEGTKVFTGVPEEWDTFGIFAKTAGRWVKEFGGATAKPPEEALAVVVEEVEGKVDPDEWLTRPGTDADRHKIAAFRAKAWTEGVRAKQQRGWCEEFERVMLRGGVTANSPQEVDFNGFRLGQVVTPEQAAGLPVGTALTVLTDTAFAIFERVENSSNRAGTRRVDGFNFAHHYAPQMVISGIGGIGGAQGLRRIDDRFALSSPEFMDLLPLGTLIGQANNAERYKKIGMVEGYGDRQWVSCVRPDTDTERGRVEYPEYNNHAFSPGPTSNWVVFRIGERK